MAKERYINADQLIQEIYKIANSGITMPYTSGSMESQINTMIQQALRDNLNIFFFNLAEAVNRSATLDGPCFLCKSPRPECEALPDDNYGGNAA